MENFDNTFSITELLNLYGSKAEEFKFNELEPLNSYGKKGAALYKKDAFGRSYFMPVSIGKDKASLVDLWYPVIQIESKKNIIDTPLTERNGTVKELVNIQDYKISIKGIIISKDGTWPEDEIDKLVALWQIKEPLLIESALTDLFLLTPSQGGQDMAVITDIKLPAVKGGINTRYYELELLTDKAFSLYEI